MREAGAMGTRTDWVVEVEEATEVVSEREVVLKSKEGMGRQEELVTHR
jgi:hypothetical protein